MQTEAEMRQVYDKKSSCGKYQFGRCYVKQNEVNLLQDFSCANVSKIIHYISLLFTEYF